MDFDKTTNAQMPLSSHVSYAYPVNVVSSIYPQSIPLTMTPIMLSPESLEQIRAIVREELAAAHLQVASTEEKK